ncbi:hypothetical protein Tco_0090418 [Tanacetum coccineum]
MHNNIMADGSKELVHRCFGPRKNSQWHSPVEAAENILPVAAHEEVETIHKHAARDKTFTFKLKGKLFS